MMESNQYQAQFGVDPNSIKHPYNSMPIMDASNFPAQSKLATSFSGLLMFEQQQLEATRANRYSDSPQMDGMKVGLSLDSPVLSQSVNRFAGAFPNYPQANLAPYASMVPQPPHYQSPSRTNFTQFSGFNPTPGDSLRSTVSIVETPIGSQLELSLDSPSLFAYPSRSDPDDTHVMSSSMTEASIPSSPRPSMISQSLPASSGTTLAASWQLSHRDINPLLQEIGKEEDRDHHDPIASKRIRNTLSARRSRARRLAKMEYLEQRVRSLESENEALRQEMSRYQATLNHH
jgi:hypothetical protein